jgi:hypothetical protein
MGMLHKIPFKSTFKVMGELFYFAIESLTSLNRNKLPAASALCDPVRTEA